MYDQPYHKIQTVGATITSSRALQLGGHYVEANGSQQVLTTGLISLLVSGVSFTRPVRETISGAVSPDICSY